MSTPNNPFVLNYEFPDEGIEHNELDWQQLKSEPNRRARDQKTIRRANLYVFHNAAPGVSYGAWFAVMKAAKNGTSPGLPFLLKKIREIYPPEQQDIDIEQLADKGIKIFSPDVGSIEDCLTINIAKFKDTKLCARLKDLIGTLLQRQQKITQIVAFGAGMIAFPARGHNAPPLRSYHFQHAALLVIQDMLTQLNDGKAPEILLQDPHYSEHDTEVAQIFGMQVVSAELGHQMGFVSLNESTLVVDCTTLFSLMELIMAPRSPKSEDHAISYTITG